MPRLRFSQIWSTLAAMICLLPYASQALPGDLDTTFDGDGRADYGLSALDATQTLVASGVIYKALPCTTGSNKVFCLVRYNASTGAVLSLSNSPSGTNIDAGAVSGIARDPRNGDIVVAGSCKATTASTRSVCLVRFSTAGFPDTGFNASTSVNIGPSVALASVQPGRVVVLPNGSIRVAAGCPSGSAADQSVSCVFGYLANGQTDSGFGSSGVSLVDPPQYVTRKEFGADLVIRPDHSVVMLSSCLDGSLGWSCVATISPTGMLIDKRAFTMSPHSDQPRRLFNVGVNQYIAAGIARNGANIYPVAYKFGYDASAVTPSGDWGGGNSRFSAASFASDSSWRESAFTWGSDRQLYLSTYDCVEATPCSTQVRRIDPAGRFFDQGWGTLSTVDLGTGLRNAQIVVDATGVYVAGTTAVSTPNGLRVFKLKNHFVAAAGCSLDLDGDGQVLASTDALLLARIAAGMTGNTAVNNAQSPNAAPSRTGWTNLRNYLATECGLQLAP
jgi:hypothetical protein